MVAHAKAGFKTPEAADLAGPGLKAVCRALGIPPRAAPGLLRGQTRIVNLVAIRPVPGGGAGTRRRRSPRRPERILREDRHHRLLRRASRASRRCWGWRRRCWRNKAVTDLLLNGLEAHLGARFAVQPDPFQAAQLIIGHIEGKRRGLGLDAR